MSNNSSREVLKKQFGIDVSTMEAQGMQVAGPEEPIETPDTKKLENLIKTGQHMEAFAMLHSQAHYVPAALEVHRQWVQDNKIDMTDFYLHVIEGQNKQTGYLLRTLQERHDEIIKVRDMSITLTKSLRDSAHALTLAAKNAERAQAEIERLDKEIERLELVSNFNSFKL